MKTSPALKLPRQIELDPRRESIQKTLDHNRKVLWERGTLHVPHLNFLPSLEKALKGALLNRQLEFGIEGIERLLAKEEKGLSALRKKQGTDAVHRISRLLIVSNDGAERFYRSCEKLLLAHSDRVLGIQINVTNERLTQNLFKTQKIVRALLVADRDAVSNVLLSLTSADADAPSAPAI